MFSQTSGFDILKRYYEENKHRKWTEWLELHSIFPHPGKQGLVGLMKSTENSELLYVFKLSQSLNFLISHEACVMQGLEDIAEICPQFCRAVGTIICEIDPSKKKDENPFAEKNSRHTVEKEVILMQYVPNSRKLSSLIYSSNISEQILYSAVKQVLGAITIAQKKCKFTHYDLHSNNIMMRKCSKNLVLLYVIDDKLQFYTPTYGYLATIIDFGFAHIQNEPYLYCTMNHTDIGFCSDRFDAVADTKLFLITAMDEIKHAKRSKTSRELLSLVKDNYSSLNIDWSSGWDKGRKKCATDYVLKALRKSKSYSKILKEYEYYCMDIIQSLIMLPLEKQDISLLDVSYRTFTLEFSKIEREIGTPFYCLYILRGIVEAARAIRSDYLKKDENIQKVAMSFFRTALHERIDSIAEYCQPKNLDYEKLLCSLLALTKAVEGILYESMLKLTNRKNDEYNSIPFALPEEAFLMVQNGVQENYNFTEKNTILVMDLQKGKSDMFNLNTKQIEEINECKELNRGCLLYNFWKNNIPLRGLEGLWPRAQELRSQMRIMKKLQNKNL